VSEPPPDEDLGAADIQAAGTVLWRPAAAGVDPPPVEIALVHRVRRDDWGLPKGKLAPGETWAAGAVRETLEETGHRVHLGPPLPTQAYPVEGRAKTVRYWSARSLGGHEPMDDGEIDRVAWVAPVEARSRLSYPHDADVVDAFVEIATALPPEDDASPIRDVDVLVVLRHARAVKRAAWHHRDERRPLDDRGHQEAVALVPWLDAYGPSWVISSDSVRCLDTVRPYAAAHGLDIEEDQLFSEEGFARRPRRAVSRLDQVLRTGGRTVLCTHRPVLPSLLRRAVGRRETQAALPLPPGGAIVVHHVAGTVVSVERHGPEDLGPD